MNETNLVNGSALDTETALKPKTVSQDQASKLQVESTNENHLGGKTDQKVIKDADVALDHNRQGEQFKNQLPPNQGLQLGQPPKQNDKPKQFSKYPDATQAYRQRQQQNLIKLQKMLSVPKESLAAQSAVAKANDENSQVAPNVKKPPQDLQQAAQNIEKVQQSNDHEVKEAPEKAIQANQISSQGSNQAAAAKAPTPHFQMPQAPAQRPIQNQVNLQQQLDARNRNLISIPFSATQQVLNLDKNVQNTSIIFANQFNSAQPKIMTNNFNHQEIQQRMQDQQRNNLQVNLQSQNNQVLNKNNISAPVKSNIGVSSLQPHGASSSISRNSLQNLKQNQNLFLSLQSKEDKMIRWKYTLLVLENMLDQILSPDGGFSFTSDKEFEIDFVKISDNLPKLMAKTSGQAQNNQTCSKAALKAGQKQQSEPVSGGKTANSKLQKTSVQPRICSKLWESMRKSFRESFKMELEFFDHTRQEIVENFWTESLLMFKQRIRVYYENQDLLTIKQRDKKQEGINYIESELRAQRLIEHYCDMCEQAEHVGITSRSKGTLVQIGQNLKAELEKQDKITSEDEQMVLDDCDRNLGEKSFLYNKIDNVLNKILNEVNRLHLSRQQQLFGSKDSNQGNASKNTQLWTNVEIAQLLVAVYNLGEGEWYEIQKRLNFETSGIVKSPNQIAHKWRSIKRVMKRDIKRVLKNGKGKKLFTKHDWIIQTLQQMNAQDHQSIGLGEEHFQILKSSLMVNPYQDSTPYQTIIDKYQSDQQQQIQDKNLLRQEFQKQKRLSKTQNEIQQEQSITAQLKMMAPDVTEQNNLDQSMLAVKQTHSQRFQNENLAKEEIQKEENVPSKKPKIENPGGIEENQVQNNNGKKVIETGIQDSDITQTQQLEQVNNQKVSITNNNFITETNDQKIIMDFSQLNGSQNAKKNNENRNNLKKIRQLSGQLNEQSIEQVVNADMNAADNVNRINKKQIKQVLDNLSVESSSNFVNQGLQISAMGKQVSSIHEIQPSKQSIKHNPVGQSITESNKNIYFNNQQKRKGSIISSNSQGSANLPIQTSQTLNQKESQIQQQITINNNINITTIHNGPTVPGHPSPNAPSLNQIRFNNPLNRNQDNAIPQNSIRSISGAYYGSSRQRNENLNLLYENPLNQIQAPKNVQPNLNNQDPKNPLKSILGKFQTPSQQQPTKVGGPAKSQGFQDLLRAQSLQKSNSTASLNNPAIKKPQFLRMTPSTPNPPPDAGPSPAPIEAQKGPAAANPQSKSAFEEQRSSIGTAAKPEAPPSLPAGALALEQPALRKNFSLNPSPMQRGNSLNQAIRMSGMSQNQLKLHKLQQKKMHDQKQLQAQQNSQPLQQQSQTQQSENSQQQLSQQNPAVGMQRAMSTSQKQLYMLQKIKQQNNQR